jgi:hypothetical protein
MPGVGGDAEAWVRRASDVRLCCVNIENIPTTGTGEPATCVTLCSLNPPPYLDSFHVVELGVAAVSIKPCDLLPEYRVYDAFMLWDRRRLVAAVVELALARLPSYLPCCAPSGTVFQHFSAQ